MELRLYTFADLLPDRKPGKAVKAHHRIKELMDEIVLADRLRLDAVFSPAVILGAAAFVTLSLKYMGKGPNRSW
ncbi:MAG: hypothetical protein WEB30_18695 [Cyclobacteriaceae bacterium]